MGIRKDEPKDIPLGKNRTQKDVVFAYCQGLDDCDSKYKKMWEELKKWIDITGKGYEAVANRFKNTEESNTFEVRVYELSNVEMKMKELEGDE